MHNRVRDMGYLVKVGDLIRNRNSESGLIGIIVGWHDLPTSPIVLWADGRKSWIIPAFAEVLNESR